MSVSIPGSNPQRVESSAPKAGITTAKPSGFSGLRDLALRDHVVHLEKRGLWEIEKVTPDAIALTDLGLKLDKTRALHDGEAVCVDTGRSYGRFTLIGPRTRPELPAGMAHRSLLQGMLNALFGRKKTLAPEVVDPKPLRLALPDNLRKRGDAMRLFAAEIANIAKAENLEEGLQELESRGYREVRAVALNDNLAFVALDPSARAIVCAFRCATRVDTALNVLDDKMVREDGLEMPRGLFKCTSSLKEGLDPMIDEMMRRNPEAELVVVGHSHGGGTALQWLSRRLNENGLDADRVANVQILGPSRAIGAKRAKELRDIFGPRLDVVIAKGDWMAPFTGSSDDHDPKDVTPIGNRPVSIKYAHSSSYAAEVYRNNLKHRPASDAELAAGTAKRNQELASRYPSLAYMLRDPDAFLADVRGRFEAQKRITPADPYAFDYSDYGLGPTQEMLNAVTNKLETTGKEIESLISTGKLSHEEHQERRLGRQFLREIRAELREKVESGSITYRELIELGYFVSHALQQRDVDKLGRRDRFFLKIDRGMQGHRDYSVAEAYNLYKKNEFSVFQGQSSVDSFDKSEIEFTKAVFDPRAFQLALIPTTAELDRDVFIHLAMHEIHLIGIAEEAIPADGFVRPGYDFWLHDMRHSALIWANRERYEMDNNLRPEQMARLRGQYDVWIEELHAELAGVDPKLKNAVIFFMFNFHHERGMLPVPSSFDQDIKGFFGSFREPVYMANVNFTNLLINEQAPDFTSLFASHGVFNEAYRWLQDFWQPKRAVEEEIIGGPVVNPLVANRRFWNDVSREDPFEHNVAPNHRTGNALRRRALDSRRAG